jgi:hypothetical protein
MVAQTEVQTARCTHCRTEVVVHEQYAHGDHIKCGACGTKHKVVRGEKLRLVLADAAPLREALVQNQALVDRLEAELAHARGSFGLGANGVGIALVYALYQLARNDATLNADLLIGTVLVAVVSGVVLETANYLFLAKRQAMSRLSAELEEANEEGALLRQKIREAGRV